MPTDLPETIQRRLALALRELRSHAVALLDSDGRVDAWLAGAERIFGYRSDEIVGKNIALLFVAEDLARGADVWERDTATRAGDSEDDRWHQRKDGGRIWVSGTLTALRDAEGQPAGFVKIMRARTDQKLQVEAAAGRVAALEHAETRRVHFVSTLAHELRNPLAAIESGTSLIDGVANVAPEVRFAASVVRRQVDFMSRMISDLLDVARAALGKPLLHRDRIVLQEVLEHSVEACRPLIDRRSHQVHRLVSRTPIAVDADPVKLQQVFVNLIENAAKYTPERGVIWLKLTTEGDEAVVNVRDNGVGIAPELMPHIFELFTQGTTADPSHRPQGGLGIGLALVRETVELHGGTVQASSDGTGKGSQFTVRLPLPRDQGEPATAG